MSDMVHLLWFVKDMPEGHADIELLIGVYSSEAEARSAFERVRNKRAFADFHDGFGISTYPLNRDNWTEGFIVE